MSEQKVLTPSDFIKKDALRQTSESTQLPVAV